METDTNASRKIQEIRGDSSRGGIMFAGVLAAVMVIVLLLWMRDRQTTTDFQVEIGDDTPTAMEDPARFRV